MRIFITGVRGKTGSELAPLLRDRADVEVLGGTRHPDRAGIPGVTPVRFDWEEPGTWPEALAGADAIYLVRPDIEPAPERIAALLEQAPPEARVVLLSELGAERFDPGSWAARVERAVTGGARRWTLLRPSWFMQVLTDHRYSFLDAIRADGRLAMPADGAALSWIDARDIAAVAAEALLDEAHDGRAYALTGPEAIGLPATAALMSRVTGRPVEHDDVSVGDAVDGLEPWLAELFAVTYERVRAGVYATVTGDVARVTGATPRGLKAFVVEHAESFSRG